MYLMIRNPGVADPAGFTLLGVSTTRYAGNSRTIGQFGSGSKYGIAKALRDGIQPIVVSSNLRMDFYAKPRWVSGQKFHQVVVKHSGKDLDGKNRSYTEDLGFTLEWGVADWTKLYMAFREFVANAIDGAILNGNGAKDVEIEVVKNPRAKNGHTAVFLPLTPEVQELYLNMDKWFLHFGNAPLLEKKLLPKRFNSDKIYFYRNGVLVHTREGKSLFDYNFGAELSLDESRNADLWDVRYCSSKAIRNASPADLAQILQAGITRYAGNSSLADGLWETKLDFSYMHNESDSNKDEQSKNWQAAWDIAAGKDAVATSTNTIQEYVSKKGFKSIKLESEWVGVLSKHGVSTEREVLNGLEKDGRTDCEPTPDMIVAVDKVWDLIAKEHLLNGKDKPAIKGFMEIMDAGCETRGFYKNDTVYLHSDLGVGQSHMLMQTALEEVVHHVTGAGDMSRDLQDFLFRLVAQMAWGN